MWQCTPSDRDQLESRGMNPEDIREQLRMFQSGSAPVKLDRPCRPEDGILKLSATQRNHYRNLFARRAGDCRWARFVPASGAATRMFQFLFKARDELKHGSLSASSRESMNRLLNQASSFAFFEAMCSQWEDAGVPFDQATSPEHIQDFVAFLLSDKGMGFENMPKGMVPFHRDGSLALTALEGHLYEAVEYLGPFQSAIAMHFTVNPQWLQTIKDHLDQHTRRWIPQYRFNIQFSVQSPATDTVAVDLQGNPIRDENQNLVFRPGGHGALLHNLNQIQSDAVFIKNIDNVPAPHLRYITRDEKMLLGGILLEFREKAHEILLALEQDHMSDEEIEDALQWVEQGFGPESAQDGSVTKGEVLFQRLHRPIRVCGMIINQGDPGGGPFWVDHGNGRIRPQIIEESQIDRDQPDQLAILKQSTHFNPVDLVCCLSDHHGRPFDLLEFRDKRSYFIASKSWRGQPIKALEWPGLWNGGMDGWNTLFVEVDPRTFNPVKTLFDLLKPGHQPPVSPKGVHSA